MLRISAIDVGSNAMRMVVGELDESWRVSVIENIRLPVRLGQDVFSKGYLEEKTLQQTEEAFLHFRHVADGFNVQRLRAVATSAAREAANRDLLVDRIFRTTGIEIEIISGEDEARLIHAGVAHVLDLKDKRTLLIDIGGGSVEVTLSSGRNIISTDSYNLGTVRLLETLNTQDKPKQMFGKLAREFAEAARYRIERDIGEEKIQICVGTGGNVEEIGRLRQKLFKAESDRFVTLEELTRLIERLNNMSVEERINKLKLRPDRADVILPASIVLQLIANEAGVKEIMIPNVGLKDGILHEIAEELSKSPGPQKERTSLGIGSAPGTQISIRRGACLPHRQAGRAALRTVQIPAQPERQQPASAGDRSTASRYRAFYQHDRPRSAWLLPAERQPADRT